MQRDGILTIQKMSLHSQVCVNGEKAGIKGEGEGRADIQIRR